MEDAHIVEPDVDGKGGGVFGVFDGHGGKEVALFVAKHLREVLLKQDAYTRGDIAQALIETYVGLDELMLKPASLRELRALRGSDNDDMMVNRVVQMSMMLAKKSEAEGSDPDAAITLDALHSSLLRAQEGGGSGDGVGGDAANGAGAGGAGAEGHEDDDEDVDGEYPNAGCTAVCAAVIGGQIVVANSGDSRAVLCRGGRAVALSRDHKPTDDDEFARILKAGGVVLEGRVNGSLNLSRALGDMEYKQNPDLPPAEQMVTAVPEIKTEAVQPEDEFLIIACDGIWDVLENQEAVDFVRERLQRGEKPAAICEAMCDHCLAPDTQGIGKGCDNMTAMVVVLKKK